MKGVIPLACIAAMFCIVSGCSDEVITPSPEAPVEAAIRSRPPIPELQRLTGVNDLPGHILTRLGERPHDVNFRETFYCSGEWDFGGGRAGTVGRYTLENNLVCIDQQRSPRSCRRFVSSTDETVTLETENGDYVNEYAVSRFRGGDC